MIYLEVIVTLVLVSLTAMQFTKSLQTWLSNKEVYLSISVRISECCSERSCALCSYLFCTKYNCCLVLLHYFFLQNRLVKVRNVTLRNMWYLVTIGIWHNFGVNGNAKLWRKKVLGKVELTFLEHVHYWWDHLIEK